MYIPLPFPSTCGTVSVTRLAFIYAHDRPPEVDGCGSRRRTTTPDPHENVRLPKLRETIAQRISC